MGRVLTQGATAEEKLEEEGAGISCGVDQSAGTNYQPIGSLLAEATTNADTRGKINVLNK